jgi:hypothetical protein
MQVRPGDPQPVWAVLQVAPSGRDLEVRAERWDTAADHHGYLDLYGNRCERLTIAAGASRIVYEADVVRRPDRPWHTRDADHGAARRAHRVRHAQPHAQFYYFETRSKSSHRGGVTDAEVVIRASGVTASCGAGECGEFGAGDCVLLAGVVATADATGVSS